MDDIKFFLKYGWKSIWKQKTIWIFGSLSLANQLLQFTQIKLQERSEPSVLLLPIGLFPILFFFISYIGVSYAAYSFFIGEPTTVSETLGAIKKFASRIIGCSCLTQFLFIPVLIAVYSVTKRITPTNQIPENIFLIFLPLSIFNSLWYFVMSSFFSNDWGIQKGIKEAWQLFSSHFITLAILGPFIILLTRIFYTITGIAIAYLQADFDLTILNHINIWNPLASLSGDFLYQLITGVGAAFFSVLNASIFALAYLKYSNAKIPKSLFNDF